MDVRCGTRDYNSGVPHSDVHREDDIGIDFLEYDYLHRCSGANPVQRAPFWDC
jgi:hypothetical protein